jgi:cell wall-associated NlpC family hydrolase
VNCRSTRRTLPHLLAVGAAAIMTVVAGPSLIAGATGSGTTTTTGSAPSQSQINGTQAQVASIEATIAQQEQQTAALSQQYDAAEQQLQTVHSALAATAATLSTTQANIVTDKAHLAKDAINAYVLGTAGTQISAVFSGAANSAETRTEYENTVIGDLSTAAGALEGAQAKLTATEASQKAQEQQAEAAAAQAQALQQANANATAAAEATLQQVRGTLAQEVAAAAAAQAQQEAAAAAAARTAAAAQAAAQAAANAANVAGAVGGASAGAAATTAANQAAASAAGQSGSGASGSGTPPVTKGSVGPSGSSSAAGNAAVAAAESQLGVPYQWGGESPEGTASPGFDCSGLTQWAWDQAGVSIPRTAASQYAALPHVSLSALQPGDLLFYTNLDGDGIVDHVVMYVGSGPYGSQTIIQAPETGETVSYSPVYTFDLVGAARP